MGKLGILVCWDQWYPEAARLMALAGAEILIYPTAIGWGAQEDEDEKRLDLEAWVTIQRSHAIANGIPVVSVNRVGFEPADNAPDGAGLTFWGHSFVAGQQGEFLKVADTAAEEVLVVDVDRRRSEMTRRLWPFLRDRRIDAYEDLCKRYRG